MFTFTIPDSKKIGMNHKKFLEHYIQKLKTYAWLKIVFLFDSKNEAPIMKGCCSLKMLHTELETSSVAADRFVCEVF